MRQGPWPTVFILYLCVSPCALGEPLKRMIMHSFADNLTLIINMVLASLLSPDRFQRNSIPFWLKRILCACADWRKSVFAPWQIV